MSRTATAAWYIDTWVNAPFAGDVADRPQPLTRPEPLVGVQASGRRVEADRLEAQVVEVGVAARGHEQLVGPQLPVRQPDPELPVVVDPLDRGSGVDVNAFVGEHAGDHGARLGFLRRQEPIGEPRPPARRPRTCEKTWASSQPIAPPPITTSEPGSSSSRMTSLFVQYGVSARPSIGELCRARARVEDDAASRDVHVVIDHHPAGTVQPTVTAHDLDPRLLEPLGVGGVGPVGGGLLADPRGDPFPVRPHVDVARQPRGTPCLGQQVRGSDHHLGRDAPVERALASHQAALDAHDVEASLRQLLGGVLTSRPQTHHDHVHLASCHGESVA